MIGQLADLFGHEGSKVEHAAVVCDPRGGEYFEPMLEILDELEERGVKHRLLFLEASEPVLIDRYKETRRRHPLAAGGQVSAGIGGERELLAPGARARRHHDRHERPVGIAAAQGRRGQDAAARQRREARRHGDELRVQARHAARRRPELRRPLPPESALRVRAAAADRAGPGRARVRRELRRPERVLRRASSRCSTTSCPSTRTRARRTSRSASAARAAATARS